MKVIYKSKNETWKKETDKELSFLLGNDLGDYLWLSDSPQSRYQGWFFSSEDRAGEKIYKLIEDIRPVGRKEADEICNSFSEVQRSGDDFCETFSISEDKHLIKYMLSKERSVELILDMRDSYGDFYPQYKIEIIGQVVLIKSSFNGEEIFLAIKGFEEDPKILNERFVRYYQADKERNSPPFEKAVFKALEMKGKSFTFSASKSREEALELLKHYYKKREIDERVEPIDFIAAEEGIRNLIVEDEKRIYAGFPWFFQFWKRDEAISLGGVAIVDKLKAENIFWALLESDKSGEPGRVVDGMGWIFKRSFLFLNDFDKEKEDKLNSFLKKALTKEEDQDQLLKINRSKETWMDSIPREGARIEIQALQLNMLKLGSLIDSEKSKQYLKEKEALEDMVRKNFWDGNILADGYFPDKNYVDKTVRPNIFLAYYIYPELLTEKEWRICFKNALKELWLEWGGLSTISKNDARFNQKHTGENPQSYHQGDSWFFVNNLAAIAMHRLDPDFFSGEVNQIMTASRNNLLWKGAAGHLSEISSAQELRSEGAISQAWSFATYLEALYEIFKIRNFDWL